ncbi:Receptor-type tyrosine-protein phosphatase S [Toxocara canis]|uniref:Receptor-type tyrosine-protein phosphatase S n=1 Tax=Toxocara canis TaxID=6265 RepID=A0A0B2UW90_TOXCA|nr:Receptor-type tyrosine-protein phosphatase S [Toxocara canis]
MKTTLYINALSIIQPYSVDFSPKGEKLTSSTPTTSTTSTTSATSIVPTTTTAVINVKKPQTILAVMRAFAERTNAVGVEGLRGDFAKLQQRGPHPPKMSVTAQKQNRAKCRYFDIPCLDETRVILKPWPNTSGDFIHANWVGHELIDNKFICTQAPLDNTAGDFWRMLWQEKVDLILMLCRVTEAGKQKCALYWPNNVGETKTFCGITIKNEAAPLDNTAGDFWRMLWQEKVDLILMLCRVTEAGKQKCALYWPNNVGETKTFCGITIKNEAVSFWFFS